jgi:YegS/Rv2252/BmrU family lipid kinase
MAQRGTIFVNQRSGTSGKLDLDELQTLAGKHRLAIEHLRPELDVTGMIRERISQGQNLFLAAGGDGTMHAVAQGVANTNARLAIVPVGTVNHLAKDLGIPLDWKEALEVAVSGVEKEIDVGYVNGIFFVNILMLGLYAEALREREKHRGKLNRFHALARAARMSLKRFRHISLTFESEHRREAIKTHMFAISVNAYDMSSIGFMAPKVAFDHGQLVIYFMEKASKLEYLKTLVHYFRGKALEDSAIRYFATRKLRVQSAQKQLRVGMDGELVQLTTPLNISIVPRALRIIVPRPDANSPAIAE